jgi:hypothetical protein
MTVAQLESRIATLEQKLADLAGKVGSPAPANMNAWIDDIHGTFQEDATYRRAARLGREWRKSGELIRGSRSRKAASK